MMKPITDATCGMSGSSVDSDAHEDFKRRLNELIELSPSEQIGRLEDLGKLTHRLPKQNRESHRLINEYNNIALQCARIELDSGRLFDDVARRCGLSDLDCELAHSRPSMLDMETALPESGLTRLKALAVDVYASQDVSRGVKIEEAVRKYCTQFQVDVYTTTVVRLNARETLKWLAEQRAAGKQQ